jgi:hypothetical protein
MSPRKPNASVISRLIGSLFLLWFAVLTSSGCKDAGPEPPELTSCISSWTELLPLQETIDSTPRALRWQDGILYYDQKMSKTPHVMALSAKGGTPTAIVDGDAAWMWVESEQILYAHAQDQLFAAPIDGGPSELVADGQTFGPNQDLGLIMDEELDDSHLYWLTVKFKDILDRRDNQFHTMIEWSFWRMPRDGGQSEQLGTLTDSGFPSAFALLSDRLLVAGVTTNLEAHAYTLPKDGGTVQALPSVSPVSRVIGISQAGVLWNVLHPDKLGHSIQELVLSKATGGKPVPLWPDKPTQVKPTRAWSDPSGRWIIGATEDFSDRDLHTSIWSLDRHGKARRLACDPIFIGGADVELVTGALSPSAAYFVVRYDNLTGDQPGTLHSGWKLVSVRR